MGQQVFKIPRAADRKLIDTFIRLRELINAPNIIGSTLGEVSFTIPKDLTTTPEVDYLLAKDSTLIEAISAGVAGLTISFNRGGFGGSHQEKSPIWDAIIISSDHQCPYNVKLDAIYFAKSELQPYEAGRVPEANDASVSGELIAIHSSILEKLERSYADLNEQTTVLQLKLREDAEELITDEREKLSVERAASVTELAERKTELDEKEKEVADLRAAIDDRDNTTARRAARDKLLEEVKDRVEQFGVSNATAGKRFAVRNGMIVLMTIFFCLLVFALAEVIQIHRDSSNELLVMGNYVEALKKTPGIETTKIAGTMIEAHADNQRNLLWLWARLSLLSLGLLGSFIYYIRWQDRWASQHATAEWQLRQFHLDISRANWAVESGLEWHKETTFVMPDKFVDRITHGLFVNKNNEPIQVLHPADELASALFGAASKAKLKVGENEIEFDPKKIPKGP